MPGVCRGGWWEFLAFARTLQHSWLSCQPFPVAPRSSQPAGCSPPLLMSSLKMSLSLPLEPNSITCSHYLGFGTKSLCFTPQLISSDKRSHQQIKSELLHGSAEAYTHTTSQADLYLIWFSFAILIFRNKNGSITLKKIIKACAAFSHCSSRTRVQTSSSLFRRNLQNRPSITA